MSREQRAERRIDEAVPPAQDVYRREAYVASVPVLQQASVVDPSRPVGRNRQLWLERVQSPA